MIDDRKQKTQKRTLKDRRDKITRLTRKKNFDQKHDNDRNRTFNGQTLEKGQVLPEMNQTSSHRITSCAVYEEPPNV